jgi:large conductance mechanosensitive channel
MPVISWLTGGVDFSQKYILLGNIPADYKGEQTYAALKAAGVAMLGYGSVITTIINFVLLAFVIFLIVRQANKMMPPPAAAPAGPSEVDLLTEIRDSLKKG